MSDGNPNCTEQIRDLKNVYAYLCNLNEWNQMAQTQRDTFRFHVNRINYALEHCEAFTNSKGVE